MLMTGSFLLAVIYFSILFSGMAKRASRSALIDAARSSYSGGDAEHTHSHSHGGIAHTHSHPSAVHHDQVL
jgi:hypothetical protein